MENEIQSSNTLENNKHISMERIAEIIVNYTVDEVDELAKHLKDEYGIEPLGKVK